MTGITWQKAALMLTIMLTSVGTVTYTDLFGVLFQLKGMDYNFTGDIHCGSECNISINTTTSYWRYEFANYSGTKYEDKTLFKKQSRSRTLHVNMDNIDSIITTQKLMPDGSWIPYDIEVDWMVPTYGHKWRSVKDGDSWERKKVNKIQLNFHKNPEDTIKWSFGLEEYIYIDPILFPPYNITDNIVSIDDDNVNLKAYPHTLSDSGYVTFNLTSKQFSGDIDVIWGFNSTGAMPKSVGLYKPYNITEIKTYTCDSPYRYNYTTTPKHFWCWYDYNESSLDNETNITKTQLIFDHDFDSAYPQNSSVAWSETHTEDYVDIHDKVNKIDYDYGGMNTWYYSKNVNVVSMAEYSVRAWLDVPFNSGHNKYWFCVKPSSQTLQQAIATNTLYCLDPWWNNSWNFKKKITINSSQIDSNLTDYTLLVSIFDTDLKTKAQSDGDDIAFTNNTDTQISHEIEIFNQSYNATHAQLVVWVKVPHVSSLYDTDIYMYYNNSDAADQSNKTDVWGTNAHAIYHMDDGNATYVYDSSDNSLYGAKINDVFENTTGKVGSAQDFDGTTDYIDFPSAQSLSGKSAVTTTLWLHYNSHSEAEWDCVYCDKFSGDSTRYGIYIASGVNNNKPTFYNNVDLIYASDTISYGIWYYITVTYNNPGSAYLYINGEQKGVDASTTALSTAAYHYIHSGLQSGTTSDLDGLIDELQIYTAVKSNAWINASYRNQNDVITFYSIGAEESSNTAVIVIANISRPETVYTNTDWLINMTLSDEDAGDTLTGYVNFYVNDTFIGFYSNTATNNTNTLIATLGSGNYSYEDNLTAETWAGDGTVNTSKVNLTDTVSSLTITIDSCTDLNQAGVTYEMNASISDSSTSYCMNISANNVTLDCAGFTIDGDDTADYGIYASRASPETTNITIKNCTITDWDTYGIYLYYANENNLTDLTVSSNPDQGIGMLFSSLNTLTNIIVNSSIIGIYTVLVDGCTFSNLTIYLSSSWGLFIDGSEHEISGSTFYSQSGTDDVGLYIDDDDNMIYNNTIHSNYYGIQLDTTATNNTIYNNTIYNNTYGIYMDGAGSGEVNIIYNNLFNQTNNVKFEAIFGNDWNTTNQTGTRIYSDGTNIGGNYWTNSTATGYSDTCTDSDTDGFCDTVLNITNMVTCTVGVDCGDNVDYLPLSDKYSDVEDTCTYSGSGNWAIVCNDNCSLASTNLLGNNFSIIGDSATPTTGLSNLYNYVLGHISGGCTVAN